MLTDALLVGASAAQELVSFRISEHAGDEEIRRIDGSVHHHHQRDTLPYCFGCFKSQIHGKGAAPLQYIQATIKV